MKTSMNNEELTEQLSKFRWYHSIEVAPGIITQAVVPFTVPWELIEQGLAGVKFVGKAVLDVGTRDGKWAFRAEQRGARFVRALDNDLSPGALFLKDFFQSKVVFDKMNLYDLDEVEAYDVVMFMGVLYHLRFPFLGLQKCVDALKLGGTLVIETGTFHGKQDEIPLVYCPVDDSPYEPTSCSFFNRKALEITLGSMGCVVDDYRVHPGDGGHGNVRRAFLTCRRASRPHAVLNNYWRGTHTMHEKPEPLGP